MQAMSGGPSTPIEQVTELGEQILEKLIAAGITTVEALADMTPEQLEEVPGIGEKTVEKISVAVRHYFGQYEEGEERPAASCSYLPQRARKRQKQEETSMEKTPEEFLPKRREMEPHEEVGRASPPKTLPRPKMSRVGLSDAFSDADAREEQIELDNDTVDTLVDESPGGLRRRHRQDGHDRG